MAQTMPSSLTGTRDAILPVLNGRCRDYHVEVDAAVAFLSDNILIAFWRNGRRITAEITRKVIDDGDLFKVLDMTIEEALIQLGAKERPGAFDGAAEYDEILLAQDIMDDLIQQKS